MVEMMTEDTKAVLLLCGYLDKDGNAKPLNNSEYGRVVQWLVQSRLRPADLLHDFDSTALSRKTQIDEARLVALMQRGVKLAFTVEEWERNGIWVISRGDTKYPEKLKRHLKASAPPILYGAGDIGLCNRVGLGIVGSRNVDEIGEVFTRTVAEMCSANGLNVVSGGARGVDQISMSSALNSGGVVVGVLAEKLLRKTVETEARQGIANEQLVLLSPYHPNASFNVGAAMGRNKLIYGLADYTLVVSTDYQKGGTWAGATEELERPNRRPVFVRIDQHSPVGNRKLQESGAVAWPSTVGRESILDAIAELCVLEKAQQTPTEEQRSLFDLTDETQVETAKADRVEESSFRCEISDNPPRIAKESVEQPHDKDLSEEVYIAILPIIKQCAKTPKTLSEFSNQLDINSSQIKKWLERATGEGILKKTSKPIRYSLRIELHGLDEESDGDRAAIEETAPKSD